MALERDTPGGPRAVVPAVMTTQPIGETISVSLSPNEWYLSVSATLTGFSVGDTVDHSSLPGNEVAVQPGNTATVTGSLHSGFTITVNYY
jgi:hypothetical protein